MAQPFCFSKIPLQLKKLVKQLAMKLIKQLA
jgi:hypothetical protein